MICDNCANSEDCKKILHLTSTMCENFCDSPIAMETFRKITSKDNIGNIIYYLFISSTQKTIYVHTGALYRNFNSWRNFEVVIHDSEFTYRRENLSVITYNTIWFTDREILDKTLKEDYKEFVIVEYEPTVDENGKLRVLEWIELRESKITENTASIRQLGEAISRNYYSHQLAREYNRPTPTNTGLYFSHDGTYYINPATNTYTRAFSDSNDWQNILRDCISTPTDTANEIAWRSNRSTNNGE